MFIVEEYKNQPTDSPELLIAKKAGKKEFSFLWGEIKRYKKQLIGLNGKLFFSNSKELRQIIQAKYKLKLKIKLNGNYPLSPLKLFSNPMRFTQNLLNYAKDVFIPFDKMQIDDLTPQQIMLLEKISKYPKKVNQKYINGYLYYSPLILNFQEKASPIQ